MPHDERNRYWVAGAFSDRTISRSTRSTYPRARDSSRANNIPYPRPEMIIRRVDSSDTWYLHAGNDLFLRDLVFQARMQTGRRLTDRTTRFPQRDRVLERLLVEGTFDREDPDIPDSREELAMNYLAALVQRLLMRIESLEADVSFRYPLRSMDD